MGVQTIGEAEFVPAFEPREMAAKDVKHDTPEVLKPAATKRVLAKRHRHISRETMADFSLIERARSRLAYLLSEAKEIEAFLKVAERLMAIEEAELAAARNAASPLKKQASERNSDSVALSPPNVSVEAGDERKVPAVYSNGECSSRASHPLSSEDELTAAQEVEALNSFPSSSHNEGSQNEADEDRSVPRGTLKALVTRLHAEQPDWTARQIAAFTGSKLNSVTTTLVRIRANARARSEQARDQDEHSSDEHPSSREGANLKQMEKRDDLLANGSSYEHELPIGGPLPSRPQSAYISRPLLIKHEERRGPRVRYRLQDPSTGLYLHCDLNAMNDRELRLVSKRDHPWQGNAQQLKNVRKILPASIRLVASPVETLGE